MKFSTLIPFIFALSAAQAAPIAEAAAEPGFSWHAWTRNQAIYKREANSEAESDAEPGFSWHAWTRNQAIYKREADAKADAEPGFSWHAWTRNQAIYKREENTTNIPAEAKVAIFYSSIEDVDNGAEPIAIYTFE